MSSNDTTGRSGVPSNWDRWCDGAVSPTEQLVIVISRNKIARIISADRSLYNCKWSISRRYSLGEPSKFGKIIKYPCLIFGLIPKPSATWSLCSAVLYYGENKKSNRMILVQESTNSLKEVCTSLIKDVNVEIYKHLSL